MSKPTLTYFDFPGGRGEDCRLALHLAGVDFVDDRVKGKQWGERKPGTPFGALPVYREGDRELGQSNAILAYLGRKHGLHPTDPWEAARHEAILNAAEDLRAAVPRISGDDEEAKKAARTAFAEGAFTRWCTNMEAQIQGPLVSGGTVTVADLKLFVLLRWFLSGGVDHVGPEYLEPFAKLRALHDAVNAHPGVEGWYSS